MSHTPHELVADFPDFADRIRELRASDAHFAKIADEYHRVNRAVHRSETNVEPCDDLQMIALRKERMSLKDQAYAILTGASADTSA